LALELQGTEPPQLRAVTVTDGLPDPTLSPRGRGLHPAVESDVTLVSTVLVP
jgi:hypothetical protein